MTHELKSTWIDHIPAIWVEPQNRAAGQKLAIVLNGLSGTKEGVASYLHDLARAGFVALSFDTWEHGERTPMTGEQILKRTFGNFRRYMWVNLAQTALDTLRVIDWAIATLGVDPLVTMGGLSMGGDISIAAAGIDPRICRVFAVGSTPDWLRPGMMDLTQASHPPLPTGAPDAYSRWLYEQFNPITHLSHYAHAPEMRFINGEQDDHVPPEAAFRFQSALAELYPRAAANVTFDMIPGVDHGRLFGASAQWWPRVLAWLARPFS